MSVFLTDYITKEIDFWPGNDAFKYTIGTPELLNSESRRLGEGWSKEASGSRITGDKAFLYFEGLPANPTEFILKCSEVGEDVNVTVNINDQNSFQYLLKRGEDTISLVIPELKEENWKMSFSFASNSIQSGHMGVFVKEVQINEIKD